MQIQKWHISCHVDTCLHHVPEVLGCYHVQVNLSACLAERTHEAPIMILFRSLHCHLSHQHEFLLVNLLTMATTAPALAKTQGKLEPCVKGLTHTKENRVPLFQLRVALSQALNLSNTPDGVVHLTEFAHILRARHEYYYNAGLGSDLAKSVWRPYLRLVLDYSFTQTATNPELEVLLDRMVQENWARPITFKYDNRPLPNDEEAQEKAYRLISFDDAMLDTDYHPYDYLRYIIHRLSEQDATAMARTNMSPGFVLVLVLLFAFRVPSLLNRS